MIEIIAELGQNTRGDLDVALRMVEAAAEAGCTGIKVQAYETADFLPLAHPDWEMFEDGRLWWDAIGVLRDEVRGYDLTFGATPTSIEGVARLAAMGVDFLKNGSDFLPRHDLIQAMLDTGLPTWVSTGMATLDEIFAIPEGAHPMVCTSLYPCPDDQANLARVWNPRFQGYSDHTQGIVAATVCAYLMTTLERMPGRRGHQPRLIEKHFTLDKNADGPDHTFSADPQEMADLVTAVRRVEQMVGTSDLGPTPGEQENRDRWRVTEGALRTG